ncbi:MAG: DUF3035 domain-containing protein, partial [Alphaproteobacteria bacterium]
KESTGAADEASDGLVDKLLFWKEQKTTAQKTEASIIDAKGESRRIRENAALGKPANSGQTPIIRRKE